MLFCGLYPPTVALVSPASMVKQRPPVAFDHGLPGEFVLEPLASRLAHPPPQVGIIQQPGDLRTRSTGSPGSKSRPVARR